MDDFGLKKMKENAKSSKKLRVYESRWGLREGNGVCIVLDITSTKSRFMRVVLTNTNSTKYY